MVKEEIKNYKLEELEEGKMKVSYVVEVEMEPKEFQTFYRSIIKEVESHSFSISEENIKAVEEQIRKNKEIAELCKPFFRKIDEFQKDKFEKETVKNQIENIKYELNSNQELTNRTIENIVTVYRSMSDENKNKFSEKEKKKIENYKKKILRS